MSRRNTIMIQFTYSIDELAKLCRIVFSNKEIISSLVVVIVISIRDLKTLC